ELMLWKPHGAANLLAPIPARNFIMYHVESYYRGPLQWHTPGEARRKLAQGFTSIPPAMSLFAPGKPTVVGVDSMKAAREEWAAWVTGADYIVAIGAAPHLADSHVWQPIIASAASIWYIG